MKSKLTLLGCGHLVAPLVESLSKTHSVIAITSSDRKKAALEELGAKHFAVALPAERHLLPQIIAGSDYLLISLPPGLRRDPNQVSILEGLTPFLPQQISTRVIFISSLSVYGAQGVCHEEHLPRPQSAGGKLLVQVESEMRAKYGELLTILRPAGLIDHDRHPAKYLSGKELSDSHERIHLIQESDVRAVILRVLENAQSAPLLMNLVHPSRQTKAQYYSEYCQQHQLAPPIVSPSLEHLKFSRDISSVVLSKFWPEFNYRDLAHLKSAQPTNH